MRKTSIVFATLVLGLVAVLSHAQAPVPLINLPLVPDATGPGGPQFTLTVNGTGFVSNSTVNWNGSPLATTFVSGSQLTAVVPAVNIATASTGWVTVVNPAPGGGTSNTEFFEVTNATPTVPLARSDFATGGGDPEGIAVADLNGDGKLDLVVTNGGCCGFGSGNTLAVMLGNGDGTFQPPVLYATGNVPMWVALADFNSDGKLDAAVTNQGDNTVSILLGNGDGTFQPQITYATGAEPESVVAADLNGDGKLDLVTANAYVTNTVSVLLGNGDGTFQPHVDYVAEFDLRQAIAGDFNGDGKLDLATANQGDSTVSILLGNGDGTFQGHVDYQAGRGPFGLVAADFNGDGKLDLAVTNWCCGTVNVLLGNGDGTFRSHVGYPTGGPGPTRIAAADLNGDGYLDLIVTDWSVPLSNNVSVLLGNGDGTFGAPKTFAANTRAVGVVAGDFNQDGRLDLAVGASEADTVSVLLQVAGPQAVLSPTSLNFGSQLIDTASAAQRITLSNPGIATLDITSIVASNSFFELNNCGSTLAAGANCNINVFFSPHAVGTVSGTITLTDNASTSPQTVSLTGAGTLVGLSPSTLNFSNQTVGTTSAPQTVTMTNHGNRTLSVAFGLRGANPGDYAQTNTCGNSLAAGASCTISVTFTPQAAGSRTATLDVVDNGGGSPQTVTLKGYGI